MYVNYVNFAGNSMFPSTPILPGVDKEFAHSVLLSGSPRKIHPHSVSVTVEDPGFFKNAFNDFSGNGTCNDHVTFWTKDHEVVGNNPSDPGVIIGLGFETSKNPGMIADHPVNPLKRIR